MTRQSGLSKASIKVKSKSLFVNRFSNSNALYIHVPVWRQRTAFPIQTVPIAQGQGWKTGATGPGLLPVPQGTGRRVLGRGLGLGHKGLRHVHGHFSRIIFELDENIGKVGRLVDARESVVLLHVLFHFHHFANTHFIIVLDYLHYPKLVMVNLWAR